MNIKRQTVEVPTPEPIDLQKVVNEAVEKRLLGKTIESFHCTSCYVVSDAPTTDNICRTCARYGLRPNLLHYTGLKMGFVGGGVPSDLLEILRPALTDEQIWQSSHETLARIWDEQTSQTLPSTVTDLGHRVVGNTVAKKLEFGDLHTYPPRQRPLTPKEKEEQKQAGLDQQSADKARRAKAHLARLEDNVNRARDVLERERQAYEAEGHNGLML